MQDPEPAEAPPPFDATRFRVRPLAGSTHRADIDRFAVPVSADATAADWFDALPDFLGVRALRGLAAAIVAARRADQPVVWGLGGHVIKVGLGPLLIDLARRGYVQGFVLNGASAIHDVEVAMHGSTSEDVAAGIFDGAYGAADETGAFFATAAETAHRQQIGLGTALSRQLRDAGAPQAAASLLVCAATDHIPVTVHVALGTDTVHMHPACSGEHVGGATHRDFLRLTSLVASMRQGVYVNMGSAVILPEVFMKAVTMAHNALAAEAKERGEAFSPHRIVTGNLDMLRHYRPRVNVLERPATKGYDLAGQHEWLIPLLRFAILHEDAQLAPRSGVGA